MFVRLHTIKGRGEKSYTYLEIALDSRRDYQGGEARVCSLGRVEELQQSGAVDRMIAKLAQVAVGQWVRWDAQEVEARWCKDYGPVLLARGLWLSVGLGRIIGELRGDYPEGVPVEEALTALVANRLWQSPNDSDISVWLTAKVYAPEWGALEPYHLCRSLDFLDEHMPAVEDSLFASTQDLLPLDRRLAVFPPNRRRAEGLTSPGYSCDAPPEQVGAALQDFRTDLGEHPECAATPQRRRGYIGVCFLALVLEAALQRMLHRQGCNESMGKVLDAVREVKAVRVEVAGRPFLMRTELPHLATQAFAAVGISPPPAVCPMAEERDSAVALPKERYG